LLLGTERHARPEDGFRTEYYPQSIAIADLNGDGRPDLAIGNYFQLLGSILPGIETARLDADDYGTGIAPPRSRLPT